MKRFSTILSLLCLVFFVSCSKEKNEETTQSKHPYYFIATINGKLIKYEADDEASLYGNGPNSTYSANDWDDIDISEGTIFMNPLNPTRNIITIQILKHFNNEPTAAERLAMFHTGSYSYGKTAMNAATVNGAVIGYIDDQGVEWSSENGDQTGNTFTITELSDNTNGYSKKLFKATFSCKLYDGEGHTIQVTNAEVRGQAFEN